MGRLNGSVSPRRKLAKRLTGAVFLAAFLFVAALGMMNPGNVAQTRPDHPDPRLRTRHYATTISELQEAIRELAPTLRTYLRTWHFVSMQESKGTGQVDLVVPVIIFSDDLVVTSHETKGGVTCDVRSASRVGKGDFGENARHIRQLLSALDHKFKSISETR